MKFHSPHTFIRRAEAESSNTAYKNSIRSSAYEMKKRGVPIIFTLKHLAYITNTSYQALYDIIRRKSTPYKEFKILKRNKTHRMISAPTQPLRDVQKFICTNILYSDFYTSNVYTHAYSYKKGTNIFAHANIHCAARWLVKIDIKNFFPSCSEILVYNIFKKMGYSPLFSFELARLTTWPSRESPFFKDNIKQSQYLSEKYSIYTCYNCSLGALPQGAPSSPPLSNLVFFSLDNKLEDIANSFSCMYTRYADDLYFSSRDFSYKDGSTLIKAVSQLLGTYGFQLNKEKTKIFNPRHRKCVAGLIINGSTPSIGKSVKEEIKKHIFFIKKNGIQSQVIHEGSRDANSFLKYLVGKINYIQMIDKQFAFRCMKELQSFLKESGYIYPKFY